MAVCDVRPPRSIAKPRILSREASAISLAPIDSGFHLGGIAENPTLMTSPNQLYSVAIRAGKAYVTSVSASPERPIKFNTNVQPVVYVADLATSTELRSPGSSSCS